MGRRLYVTLEGGAPPIAAAMIARAAAPAEAAAFALLPDAPAQLSQLVQRTQADEVADVDVGGALLTAGGETSRRDAHTGTLVLAAMSRLEVPGVVLVTGLGVDGERSSAAVADQLTLLGAERWATLGAEHVDPFSSAVESLSSEPTGLLSLAARGWRGTAERHSPAPPAELTEHTPVVYRVDARTLAWRVHADDPLGVPPTSVATTPCLHPTGPGAGDARRQAVPAGAPPRGSFPQTLARLDEYGQAAVSGGVDFLTMHRVAEVLALTPRELGAFRRALRTSRCPRYAGAGWSLLPASMTGPRSRGGAASPPAPADRGSRQRPG